MDTPNDNVPQTEQEAIAANPRTMTNLTTQTLLNALQLQPLHLVMAAILPNGQIAFMKSPELDAFQANWLIDVMKTGLLSQMRFEVPAQEALPAPAEAPAPGLEPAPAEVEPAPAVVA